MNNISDLRNSRFISRQRGNVKPEESVVVAEDDSVNGKNDYVPMLNKVMNLTYMSSKVIRGRKSFNINRTKKRITDPNSVPSASIKIDNLKQNEVKNPGNFFTFTPEIYNDMNLSYMNSNVFRGENSRSIKDNSYIRPKQVLRKRKRVLTELPRAVSISNTNTIKHDLSTKQNDYNLFKNPKHENTGNIYPGMMKWMWPPNSMNFNNFNFEAFDAQFERNSDFGQSRFVTPSIPTSQSLKFLNPVQSFQGNSPSYSLSIIL